VLNKYFSSRKKAFELIYEKEYWGKDVKSGGGSTLEATVFARQIISKVISDHSIKSIVDVACGDLTWMPLVLEELKDSVMYTGCDIVESLITDHQKNFPQYNFQPLYFVEEKIPKGELIICREALQHLPIKDIKQALHKFSISSAKYLLATTYLRTSVFRNKRNIRPGRCRNRNLLIEPFNLPNPLVIYSEQSESRDKFIGLWSLPF
jgi:hypothetical protein